MKVKTNVYLSEADIRLIVKKHLQKEGFKVIGELEVLIKTKQDSPKELVNGDNFGILAEVQKQFKSRISLPNES